MNRGSRVVLLAGISLLATAYAGSRDAYFAGSAGPYPLRVVVHTPGVIPGLANITVAVSNAEEVSKVSVQPIFWNVPADRAPAPDIARRAEGGEFHAELWLMVSGSYGVRVNLQGTRGDGTVVVPVSAVAYQRLEMSRGMGALLLGLTLFLAAGLVTIVRAAARESTVAPGGEVTARERRRGWVGLAAGTVIVSMGLIGGHRWWSRVDNGYHHRIYQPPETRVSFVAVPYPSLQIAVTDSFWTIGHRDRRPLVDDGGKSAHVFLVGDNAFAHLHPNRADSSGWQVALPPIPAGSYRVFTEVVDSSGFTETLVSSVQIPEIRGKPGRRAMAPDGFWFVESDQRECMVVSDQYPCRRLEKDETITLRTDRGFAFEVRTPQFAPLPIDWSEPEAADAFILKPNGEIVHLRPYGTISAAAIAHYGGSATAPKRETGGVVFPYPLPSSAGERVWLSVHAGGKRMMVRYDLAAANP